MTDKGHNKPPFDPAEIVDLEALPGQLRETYKFKFDRVKELVDSANLWLGAIKDDKGNPLLETAGDASRATDCLAQLKAEIDACHGKDNSVHTVAKAPFLKGGRIVDQVLNAELVDPLRKAVDAISKPLKAYHERIAAEAALKARLERERLQKEAEEAAAKVAAAAVTEEDLEKAMEAEQAAIEAVSAPAPKADLVRGDYGTSSGLRGKWKARVADADKIPRQYMMPNIELIAAALKTSPKDSDGKPSLNIPGVEFYFETSLATRR